MTPSLTILTAATKEHCIVDHTGRRLTVRDLTALDKLRLFKAAGPNLSLNQPWLAVAILAASVVAIDDVPVLFPGSEAQIESLVGRLGDTGLEAVADVLEQLQQPNETEQLASAGNLSGTPS